jgi:hypothetical protein
LLGSAWSALKIIDWNQSGLTWSDGDTGLAVALFLGLLLYLAKAWVMRLLLYLLFRLGNGWLSTELAGVSMTNRLLQRGYRLPGIRNGKSLAFPARFRSLIEASIDPEEEQEKRLSEAMQKGRI